MYTQDEVKAVCAEMFDDLRMTEEGAELSEDGLSALIPYYAHGRMNAHSIDLELMAKSALIYARREQPQTQSN
ncbi:hypothetical protein Q4543_17515 [Salipiger sp. 1_MG-2023]|uniref:hypothetical protein n=1 Tax=Salipiger sp. 1_MG-2023 TaxID=3062665 RepID=UPI0026E24479|nr:hypothetical protein [Salipiger sp. 1_MG-2023]MDO6587313.1 hypothetical protein [Salipiger sp. 1_MG-2023]